MKRRLLKTMLMTFAVAACAAGFAACTPQQNDDAELGIGRGTIHHRKASIRQRYYNLYGAF